MKAVSLIEFIVSTDWKTQGKLLDYIGLPEVPNKTNIRIYANFLNQPFTPELIVEKFKGWVKDNECDIYYYKDTSNFIECKYDKKYSVNGTMFLIPRTLADFINDCQRAGIELEFKEQ